MNKEAFLAKKPLGKNEFEEGIEFGCIAAWLWYLCWWDLSFYVSVKTQNITYVLGTMSFGVFIGMWLKSIIKVFCL
jgi:hypothetical protein